MLKICWEFDCRTVNWSSSWISLFHSWLCRRCKNMQTQRAQHAIKYCLAVVLSPCVKFQNICSDVVGGDRRTVQPFATDKSSCVFGADVYQLAQFSVCSFREGKRIHVHTITHRSLCYFQKALISPSLCKKRHFNSYSNNQKLVLGLGLTNLYFPLTNNMYWLSYVIAIKK